MSRRFISSLFLVLVFVVIRTAPVYAGGEIQEALANISPMAALALCGGMFLPRRLGVGITFGAFIMSDILINLHYHQPLLNPYSVILLLVFAGLFMGGHFLSKSRGVMVLLGASVVGTVLFYLAGNTAAFFYDPAYPKGFPGWIQANTLGVPGYPPAWAFGLRSLAGNLVFAAAFYLALRPRREDAVAATPVRVV